jgi:hypothetical protein
MTAKQRAAEKAEHADQLARHQRERVELERLLLEADQMLKSSKSRKRRELDFRQLKESFQLSAKYGHEIGPGGRSILDGTYRKGRR